MVQAADKRESTGGQGELHCPARLRYPWAGGLATSPDELLKKPITDSAVYSKQHRSERN